MATSFVFSSAGLNSFVEMLLEIADNEYTAQHEASLGTLSQLQSGWGAVQLSATQVVLANSGFTATLTGSGLSPVGTLAELEDAIANGIATGAFDQLVFERGGVEILSISFADTGYTMTSGNISLELTGDLPTDFGELFTLMEILDSVAIAEFLTPAERAAVILQAADFGLTGLTLSDGGSQLFSITLGATGVSLFLEGWEIALRGIAPADFGDVVEIAMEMAINPSFSPSSFAGLDLTQIEIIAPGGATVFDLSGDLLLDYENGNLAAGIGLTIVGDGQTLDFDHTLIDPNIPDNIVWTLDTWFIADNFPNFVMGLAGNDSLEGGDANDTLDGGPGSDTLNGGLGDDLLRPGSNNNGYDLIFASLGNDTIDFVGASDLTSVGIYHDYITGPITASVNAVAGTGTITFAGGTTTLQNVDDVVVWALVIDGTNAGDTFDLTVGSGQWMGLNGGGGNNTFNLTNDGIIRLSYSGAHNQNAATGIVLNLATGVVSNNGFGGTDQINILGGSGVIEIQATSLSDLITGSNRDERFILLQGNDTLDGGGGRDELRFDRSGVEWVNVNLATGVATGVWYSQSFSHTISGIEVVRGSREGADSLIGDNNDNQLEGRGGNDTLSGGGGNDTLLGEDGNDSLVGGAGDDSIDGGSGIDVAVINDNFGAVAVYNSAEGIVIVSSDGMDVFKEIESFQFADVTYSASQLSALIAASGATVGTSGNDTLTGGIGPDVLIGLAGFDMLSGLQGDDTLFGGSGNDTLIGDAGDDVLNGEDLNDSLNGGFGDDTLNGGAGADTLIGGTDQDVLNGGTHNDLLEGQQGDDELNGEGGADTLIGGLGNDTLNGGDLGDWLRGDAGNDVLDGGNGNDRIVGGDDADVAYGRLGNDLFFGGQGFDTLYGLLGDDTLFGGLGNDKLFGGVGNDSLIGADQNDTLVGDWGNDFMDGGTGDDWMNGGGDADYLVGRTGNDTIFGGQGFDTLIGQLGNDVLYSGWGNDEAYGGDGNDEIWGGNQNDTLDGGSGADTLNGGKQDDRLIGGTDSDLFIFIDGDGVDVIVDFDATDGNEKIDLSGVTSISSLADLDLGHASAGAAQQVGANVVIDTGFGHSITLLNVNIGDLDASDFMI